MSADLFPEVLLASVYVLVPGCALCLATGVGVGRSFFTFLALAFGLGYAGVATVSVLLALVGVFEPAALAVSWVGGCAVALIVALRRGAFRAHARGWLEHVRSDPWATAGAAVAVIGVAIARSMIAPVTALAPTVLRNWSDALEIADAGRIPEGTLQWGTVLPPITSKVVLNAFNAGASMLLGRDVAVPQAALLSVVTIGLVVIVIALLSEMGVRRLAPLGALLLLMNHLADFDLSTDLGRNLAEDWGRLASFSGVLCGVLAMRLGLSAERSEHRPHPPNRIPLLVVGGILLGIAAGTHLVSASVGVAITCAIALASMIVSGWTRSTVLATGANPRGGPDDRRSDPRARTGRPGVHRSGRAGPLPATARRARSASRL